LQARAKAVQMAISTTDIDNPVLFAGPFPPPLHGQSLCTKVLADKLCANGLGLLKKNLSGHGASPVGRLASKMLRHVTLPFGSSSARSAYISANSNAGMWLTAIAAGMLRFSGKRLFIHHHAYDHVRRRRLRMVALALAAGPDAVHVVLGNDMATQLQMHTPGVKHTFVLGNAGLVDPALTELTNIPDGLCLGHLSNLSKDKGIEEVVELALALHRSAIPVKLLVAGSTTDEASSAAIERATASLGDNFVYLGPVAGAQKLAFFKQISHFIFPSRYRNEASPLVLLEAMAADVPCVCYDIGCIVEDVGSLGGLVIPKEADFVTDALSYLCPSLHDEARQPSPRAQFDALLREHELQIRELAALLRAS